MTIDEIKKQQAALSAQYAPKVVLEGPIFLIAFGAIVFVLIASKKRKKK